MLTMSKENRAQLKSSETIYRYLTAGRGIVTLESPTGKSHTYLFQKPCNPTSFPDDVLFVYAVHEDKQFYVGMVEDDRFRLTRNSRFLPETEVSKGAFFIWRMALYDFDTPMKLYHEGVCGRCGRVLTTDKSREIGIGRKCLKVIHDNELIHI